MEMAKAHMKARAAIVITNLDTLPNALKHRDATAVDTNAVEAAAINRDSTRKARAAIGITNSSNNSNQTRTNAIEITNLSRDINKIRTNKDGRMRTCRFDAADGQLTGVASTSDTNDTTKQVDADERTKNSDAAS